MEGSSCTSLAPHKPLEGVRRQGFSAHGSKDPPQIVEPVTVVSGTVHVLRPTRQVNKARHLDLGTVLMRAPFMVGAIEDQRAEVDDLSQMLHYHRMEKAQVVSVAFVVLMPSYRRSIVQRHVIPP